MLNNYYVIKNNCNEYACLDARTQKVIWGFFSFDCLFISKENAKYFIKRHNLNNCRIEQMKSKITESKKYNPITILDTRKVVL